MKKILFILSFITASLLNVANAQYVDTMYYCEDTIRITPNRMEVNVFDECDTLYKVYWIYGDGWHFGDIGKYVKDEDTDYDGEIQIAFKIGGLSDLYKDIFTLMIDDDMYDAEIKGKDEDGYPIFEPLFINGMNISTITAYEPIPSIGVLVISDEENYYDDNNSSGGRIWVTEISICKIHN